MENFMRLKNFIVKTVERIVDPKQTTKITRDLFDVRNFLKKIPKGKKYLKFINDEFEVLKKTPKYKIEGDNISSSNSILKEIEVFM